MSKKKIVVKPEAEPQVAPVEAEQPKKKFKWTKGKIIGLSVSATALMLVVAIVISLSALGIVPLMRLFGKDNDVMYKNQYTASDFMSGIAHDQVVATMGDYTLTNGQLQVFYWMTFYEMVDYYGQYAEYYLGVDLDKPLGEQQYQKTEKTWEQYVLGEAVATWHRYQAAAAEADKAGFKMPAEYQEDFAKMESSLEETAKEQKFDSLEAMLESEFGKNVTFDDYYHYLWIRYTAELYFSDVIANLKFTDAELDAFFQENKDDLAEYGVAQDDSTLVDFRNIFVKAITSKDADGKTVITDESWETCRKKAQDIYDTLLGGDNSEETFAALAKVKSEDSSSSSNGGLYQYVPKNKWATVDARHILIMPEGGTKDASGNVTYSEEEWEACRVKAQQLLDEYLAGEKTEDAFGALANKHSQDQNGKVTNGGLYENIYSGQMVKAFDAWIFDTSRTPGETGLVKTEYGYHVMYFVSRTGPVDEWAFSPEREPGEISMIKTEEGYEILFYVGDAIAWKVWCEEGLVTQSSQELMDSYTKNNSMEVKYWTIMLGERVIEAE